MVISIIWSPHEDTDIVERARWGLSLVVYGLQTPHVSVPGAQSWSLKIRFHMLQLRVYVSDKQEESQG